MRIGGDYAVDLADLTASMLVCGESQQGKTVLVYRFLAALKKTGAAITIIDGAGTLSDYLIADHALRMKMLKIIGEDTTKVAASVRIMQLSTIPTSGIGINLTALAPGETVTERTAALVSTLNSQREDNVHFNLVHEYAPAAISALVAAHRPITELPELLSYDVSLGYLEGLTDDIWKHGHLSEVDGLQLQEKLSRVLPIGSKVGEHGRMSGGVHRKFPHPTAFDNATASTVRMFRWATDNPHLFASGGSTDTFQEPGLTIIRGVHKDLRMTGLLRAAMVGAWSSTILTRPKDSPVPAYLVIDEKEGINYPLVADQLVRAANANAYFWLILQSAAQLGDAMDQIMAGVHRCIFFRQKSTISTGYLAKAMNVAKIDRTYLATVSEQEGETEIDGYTIGDGSSVTTRMRESDLETSDGSSDSASSSSQKGRSRSRTKGRERVGLPEQLAAIEQEIIALPKRTAIHVTHDHTARVTHDLIDLPSDTAMELGRRLLTPKPHTPYPVSIAFLPPVKKEKPAPPPAVVVPPAPSSPVKANGKPPGRHSR